MKKYGKYEKRPEGVREKQPKAKNALLQTYFASLLCLVLCVTMFFGTSYAWFTSEVSNTGNEIYIGILDAGLYDGEDNDLAGNKPLFDNTIYWEPGYTVLRTLSVKNEGNLAFNYTLNFTYGNPADKPSGLDEVAQCFEVWVYSNDNHTAYTKTEGETFAEMTQKAGWTKVDTLAAVLEGKAVFSGSMTAVDENGEKVNTTHTYTIALHMKEDAENATDEDGNNSLMGKSISLNVKLTAYQLSSEQDDFDNSTYDQMVSTAEELEAALQNGGTVALAADINLADERITIPAGVNVKLDLNGHNLTADYSGAAAGVAMIKVTNGATLTVEGNGEVTATTNFTTSNNYGAIFSNAGNLIVNGGTYCVTDNTGSEQNWIIACVIDNLGYACDGTTTINGGTFTVAGNAKNIIRNRPQHSGTMTLTINGGTFEANPTKECTYIWNHVDSGCTGLMNFNGGTYDAKVVYEDYNGQSDVHIAEGVTIQGYSGNN